MPSLIVSHRINARKVILTYYYMRFFASIVMHKDSITHDLLASEALFDHRYALEEQKKKLHDAIDHHYDMDNERWIEYILKQYFSRIPKEEIDYGYIRLMTPLFDEYMLKAKEQLVDFTVSFSFDQMDPMDNCIFVLALAEYSLFHTPKEVLINEMIELAKRFGDDGSPKLIHAGVHKLLS